MYENVSIKCSEWNGAAQRSLPQWPIAIGPNSMKRTSTFKITPTMMQTGTLTGTQQIVFLPPSKSSAPDRKGHNMPKIVGLEKIDGRIAVFIDPPKPDYEGGVSVYVPSELAQMQEVWKREGAAEERERLNAAERMQEVHAEMAAKLAKARAMLERLQVFVLDCDVEEILSEIS